MSRHAVEADNALDEQFDSSHNEFIDAVTAADSYTNIGTIAPWQLGLLLPGSPPASESDSSCTSSSSSPAARLPRTPRNCRKNKSAGVPERSIEKRYRSRITLNVETLRASVPSLRGEDTVPGLSPTHKRNKATILVKATEYIRLLEDRNQALGLLAPAVRHMESLETGLQELRERSRYIQGVTMRKGRHC
nr:transcription factor cph2 [Quercus suber]